MDSSNQSASPIKRLVAILHSEVGPGLLLLAMAILAMLIMNSQLSIFYEAFLNTPVRFSVGALDLHKPLLLWINDGLMAIFFFLIGLEIKRELMVGHL